MHRCFSGDLSDNVLCDFVQNFGLDVETFQHMVGDCPPDFLKMAVSCCTVRCLLGKSLFVCACVGLQEVVETRLCCLSDALSKIY